MNDCEKIIEAINNLKECFKVWGEQGMALAKSNIGSPLEDVKVPNIEFNCPCEDGIDSKACVGCEHSEDGKQYRPYRDALEFISDYGKRFPTATPRPLGTMPLIWIAHKTVGTTRLIVEFSDRSVKIGCKVKPVDFGKLFEYWTYTYGSPCGKEC